MDTLPTPGELTLRRLLEPFAAAMALDDTREIVVTRPGSFGVEGDHGWSWHNDDRLTYRWLDALGRLAGRMTHQDLSGASPTCSSRLPGGQRITVNMPPMMPEGVIQLTIRQRAKSFDPTLDWLEARGWFRWTEGRTHGGKPFHPPEGWAEWLRAKVRCRANIVLLGSIGSSKAQPLDALVLAPTGWRKMGDLKLGDLVTCPDGSTSPITGVFPQGEKPIYRVTFNDGRTAECCDDHLWKIWTPSSHMETEKSHATRKPLPGTEGGRWRVLPLSTIRQIWSRGNQRAKTLAVPLVEALAVEFPPQDLPIAPYALGALLGDGHLIETVLFSTADPFVLHRLMGDLPDYEAQHKDSTYEYRLRMWNAKAHPTRMQAMVSVLEPVCRLPQQDVRKGRIITYDGVSLTMRQWAKRRGIQYATLQNRIKHWHWPVEQALDFVPRRRGFRTRPPLVIALEELGLAGTSSHQKFIPEIYKRGSVAQRIALLQGLLDTDGHVGSTGMSATFVSCSERLAKDVREVAWSLGAVATINEHPTSYHHKGKKKAGRTSFRVNIIHPDVSAFFSLPRKVEKCGAKTMRHRLRIVSIDPVGPKQAQCIRVDHPDQLYITNDYIVTHNTTGAEALIKEIPDWERLGTLESTPEWELDRRNWAPIRYAQEKKPGIGLPTAEEALEMALRMRLDRVLFGELRNAEAWAWLRSLQTGLRGAIATAHGHPGFEGLFRALHPMIRQSPHSAAMDEATLRAMLHANIDVVLHCARVDEAHEGVPYRCLHVEDVRVP